MKQKLGNILLVDDDAGVNFINSMLIQAIDITDSIEITINGKEAINYLTGKDKYEGNEAKNTQPELILLDINMPIMDGWEFIEEYQKLQNSKSIVVMLTTSLNPADRKRAGNISAISEFITKPLTPLTLEGIIKKYFPEYQ